MWYSEKKGGTEYGENQEKVETVLEKQPGNPGEALLAAVLSLIAAIPMLCMPRMYPELDYGEAIPVTGVLEDCQVHYRDGRIQDIGLEMAGGETWYVNGYWVSETLAEDLKALPKPAQVDLRLHPRGRDVLEIQAGGEILLEFYHTQTIARREAVLFGWFGLFWLVATVGLGGWAAWLKFGPSPKKKKAGGKR